LAIALLLAIASGDWRGVEQIIFCVKKPNFFYACLFITPMDIKVARLSDCKEPSFVVGFTITDEKTRQSVYLDAFVAKTELPADATDEDIAQRAWPMVKQRADAFLEECSKVSIVGKNFVPSE